MVGAAWWPKRGVTVRIRQQNQIQIPNLTLPAYVTYSSFTQFTDLTLFCSLIWKMNIMWLMLSWVVRFHKPLTPDSQKRSSKKLHLQDLSHLMERKSSRRHRASFEREAECGCSPGKTGSPRLRHSVISRKYFTEFTLHPAFHRWNKEPQGLSGSEDVRQSMSLLCLKLPGASHLPWGKRPSPYKGLQIPPDLTSYALWPPPFFPSFPRTLQAVSYSGLGHSFPSHPPLRDPYGCHVTSIKSLLKCHLLAFSTQLI